MPPPHECGHGLLPPSRGGGDGQLPGAACMLALALLLALPGCRSIGGISGAVAGVASGSASGSPAVGIAVGIGVQAGIDATIATLMRTWSRDEQQRIADQVGAMQVGERRPWEVRHAVPYGNAQGEVVLLRAFTTPLATCREAAFSVDDPAARRAGQPQQHFVTTACLGAEGWRWAAAEPAVERWGALQ